MVLELWTRHGLDIALVMNVVKFHLFTQCFHFAPRESEKYLEANLAGLSG